MNNPIDKTGLFPQILASGRIVLVTMAVCCILYTLVILGIGQALRPYTASGSLIRNQQGATIGSELIAQKFSRPEYFWPRPSAVDYNAAASGGSNLSPTSPELRSRANTIITRTGAANGEKLPADLVTASGSGLDPHITLSAAEYQARRVASARGLSVNSVRKLLQEYAGRPGGAFSRDSLVNVLHVNMALDRLDK
jgi:K+-transporting ATPase ATPase C chain